MKHKRLILTGVLLIAVVAVVVPFRRQLLFLVAYERLTGKAGFTYYHKRISWVSGEEYAVPDQTCPTCARGDHFQCHSDLSGKTHEWWTFEHYAGVRVSSAPTWHCTCPDPRHEWSR